MGFLQQVNALQVMNTNSTNAVCITAPTATMGISMVSSLIAASGANIFPSCQNPYLFWG